MMSWKFFKYKISVVVINCALIGCNQSDYTKLVKAEVAKGIRQDSILLGINFGDSNDEYFGKCYDLNQRKLVTQGPSTSVQYLFTDSLVHGEPTRIRLLFSPTFDKDNKIVEMNLQMNYMAFMPGEKKYESETLREKIKELLMKWYKGNEFITARIKEADVPVKVDGNRRILIYPADRQSIIVRIQDLFHPKFKHSTN